MKRYRNNKGMTIIELIIASSILLVALTITFMVWHTTTRSFNVLQSHVTARQEVRKASDAIRADVRNAGYLFANRQVTVQGVNYDVGNIDVAKPDIILAIPENPNVGAVTYTIVGYHIEQNTTDPVNTNAFDLVRTEWTGVNPPTPDTPASIDLTTLTGGSRKTVARYIDPNRFSFTIRQSGNSVDIRPLARHQVIPNQQPVDVEVFMTINIKNK